MQASKQAPHSTFFYFYKLHLTCNYPTTHPPHHKLPHQHQDSHPSIHLPSSILPNPPVPSPESNSTHACITYSTTPHPPPPRHSPSTTSTISSRKTSPSELSPNISNSQACENAQPSFSSQCTVSTHPIALYPPPSEPMKGTGR